MSGAAGVEVLYSDLLSSVLDEVRAAQLELLQSSNATVIDLYWRVGRQILERRSVEGHGAAVIDRLARDLSSSFPGQRGFSKRNLQYMRAFAAAWPSAEKVQQLLHFLPWGHIQTLLDRLDDTGHREWYAQRVLDGGWSRGVLLDRLNAQLHLREGQAPSNFPARLGENSEMADPLRSLATDPYRLDFIELEPGTSERRFEQAIVDQMTSFLQHLGRGFAYMGRQYRLHVGGDEFLLDLLFYSTHLHAYVVFELKVSSFEPSHAGQLAFYVTAIERTLRRDGDGPTIGVLLVPDKNNVVVEYTLASIDSPMTVASYTYRELPAALQQELPAAADLEEMVKRATP